MSCPALVSVCFAMLCALAADAAADAPEYEVAPQPTRVLESPLSGTSIEVLVERANLGGAEVELGRITFPPHSQSGTHQHYSVEIFYVLSGELEHVVNGKATLLSPGRVGVVRPGDEVVHRVPGDEPCTALVVWAPGGEVDRLAETFRTRENE